jgi:ABC-type lipoprotein export system ATPase subunit
MALPYDQLLADLAEQYALTARFHRGAFHVHSTDSYDWGKRPCADAVRNDRARFAGAGGVQTFLNELANAGLALVAITDHMKCGFACELSKAALSRDDITVFPGMEINCRIPGMGPEILHLLAIFPEGTDPGRIERIFARQQDLLQQQDLPSDAERTGAEIVIVDDLRGWARAIEAERGMLIFAHVDDSDRGHRHRFRAVRRETLALYVTEGAAEDSELVDAERSIGALYKDHVHRVAPAAVEVMKPGDQEHYVQFTGDDGAEHGIPCIVRSDHHCLEDLVREERVTHVKVSRPDFASVREALRFHRTRIRFANGLPAAPAARVVGVRLRSPAAKGLFADLTIAFNDNLNCLIGPRGSGKSTVLEALRYALGQNPALEEVADDDLPFVGLAKGIQAANLADTNIEVVFAGADGQQRILSATYDADEDVTTKVFDEQGRDLHVAPEAIRDQFPVRIFSWAEMESLGRRPDRQRALIDRLIPEMTELVAERQRLRVELTANRTDLVATANHLRTMLSSGRPLTRHVQLKTAFDRINTEEVAELFHGLDEARGRIAVLDTVDEELQALGTQVGVVSSRPDLSGLELGDATSEWWETVARRLELDELVGETRREAEHLQAEIGHRHELVAAERNHQAAVADAKESALRAQTQADAQETLRRDQREEAKRRFDAAETERVEYLKLWDKFNAGLTGRDSLLDRLADVRGRISAARLESRNELIGQLLEYAGNMRIQIDAAAGADRKAPVTFLEDQLLRREFAGHYREQRVAERLCCLGDPGQLGRALRGGSMEPLEEALKREGTITREEADRIAAALCPFDKHEGAGVDTVEEGFEDVLRFEEQLIDDIVCILDDGVPVDRRSPGQRASAMLPLIALSEEAPLIVDQPEDNLDNRMVGQTLTNILSVLKERRQIIVATHNPNIVVGGDAEQVIVLEPEDNHRARLHRTGSIDDSRIIKEVIAIMEGGRQAFDERERRYYGVA